ncbi:4'-phosphopantetheinyl transferase superfamily protein [Dactylosporangium sp. NPDC049525]|uniref:4'-phosphopantetheinyl transferase family protein n=1 Tax=Dactylosporangium sp. NPDC049525 TaxID=3154730 RepID=UPI003413DBBE
MPEEPMPEARLLAERTPEARLLGERTPGERTPGERVAERGLLGLVLPDGVMAAEAFGDPPEATLLPQEEPVVAGAVAKRVREFTTVRHCARVALRDLGRPPAPILPGERSAPTWPAGVVGSMTHCDGFRGAAVAEATRFAAIGVDAEPHGPLPDGVLGLVALPTERARDGALRALRPELHWDRLLFCVKEAIYKAWFPLTGRWLGFEDADVTFDAAGGTFHARILVPGDCRPGAGTGPLTAMRGRFAVAGGFALAGIAVENTAGIAVESAAGIAVGNTAGVTVENTAGVTVENTAGVAVGNTARVVVNTAVPGFALAGIAVEHPGEVADAPR